MPIANVWDATANGNQGAWVPAIIGVQGYQGAQGPQGYQGSQGVQGYISPLTTKGDIFTYSTSGTKLPAGNEGESLAVIPASSTGVGYFPAQVNIQKLTIGGHSYTDNFSGYLDTNTTSISGVQGGYWNTNQSMYSRIISALDFDSGNVTYMGAAGTVLQFDLKNSATLSSLPNGIGGWVAVLRRLMPSRARKPYTNDNGLCIGVYGINDFGIDTYQTTSYLRPFTDALRTTISRFRASTTSKSVSYGTGTPVVGNKVNTGDQYLSFSNGQSFSFSTPSDFEGGTVAINFIGGASGTGETAPGGTVSIRVDGATTGFTINGASTNIFTTSGYGLTYTNPTSSGSYYSVPRVGQVARISTIAPGAHTILATVTSVNSASATVDFDSWQIESSFPNPVIIANIAMITASSPNYTVLQQWNASISGIVGEFDAPIAIANIQDLLTPTGRLAIDGIHPSELGAVHIAEEIRKAYTRMNVPLRNFVLSTSNNIKSGISTYPMANFRSTSVNGTSYDTINIGQTGLTQVGTWSTNSNVTTFVPSAFSPTCNRTYLMPIVIVEPCTIIKFTCASTAGNAGTIGFGLYYDWLGMPANLMWDAGYTLANTTTDKSISITPGIEITTPGVYWMAMYLYGGTGNTTNLRVAALTGHDPKVPNFSTQGVGGAPNGCCLVISGFGNYLASSALAKNSLDPFNYNDQLTTQNWSPLVYVTVSGKY